MKNIILIVMFTLVFTAQNANAEAIHDCGTYVQTDSCSWFEIDNNRFKIILPDDMGFPTGTTEFYVEGEARFFCYEVSCTNVTVWHCLDITFIAPCDSVCAEQRPGDPNNNEYFEIADMVYLTRYFAGFNPPPFPLANGDANGDCVIDSFDIKRIFDKIQNHENLPVECTCVSPDTCQFQTAGDLNADAQIDDSDLELLKNFILNDGEFPNYLANADVNGDCIIDINDIELLESFLAGTGDSLTDCTCSSPLYHCSEQMPGDLNDDGKINIFDIVFLKKYLSGKGVEPTILANADPNGDCVINLGDLIYLRDFITNNGPAPVDCTCIQPEFMTDCCWGRRGNIDYDSEDIVDMIDIIRLLDYMFKNGFDLVCYEEADINGDGIIDITDLIALVRYLFFSAISSPPKLCK